MRTILLLSLLILPSLTSMGNQKDLLFVRELYYKASANKNDAEVFSKFLSSSPEIKKTLLDGYKGICYMIRANHSWNPYNKLDYFNKGKKILDEAIKNDPTSIELRFLRFGVQTNAPGFLGYSGQIEEDKNTILKGYTLSKDIDLKNRIKNYLVSSSYFTTADKMLLK